MKTLLTALLTLLTLLTLPAGAAEKRVALVIGNAAYPTAPLGNPVNDANDITASLQKLGFEVIQKNNANQREMNRAIVEFGEKLRSDTIALFFYAGHGIQVKGKNYLIPVDARIASESSVRAETVDVDTVMDQLATSTLNIVILDACRNNPFERRFRGTGGGLAQMDAPTGSLIAYATSPGKTAADGDGRNGLYTQELLKHIQTPGMPLEAIFKRVRNGVIQGSGNAQTPWEVSSLTGDFYFTPPSGGQIAMVAPSPPAAMLRPSPAPAPTASANTREDPETQFWNEVKASGSREYYEAYAKQYPKGKYLGLARVELKKLEDQAKADKARSEADRKAEQARQDAEQKQAAERNRQDQQRNDKDSWEAAKSADSVTSYGAYLDSYPKGQFAALAQAAKQKAERLAVDRNKQETENRSKAAEQEKLAADRARLEAEKAAKEMRPGKVFRDCADCPEMVTLPAGSFDMGETGSTHRVTLKGFVMGKTEVTQAQWQAVMGGNPSAFIQCGSDCPVEQVSWDDIQEFVRRLNAKTGKSYRLPSEAEWEYACRAGGRDEYCGGNNLDALGWCHAAAKPVRSTNPVARKQANAWGLYDMSGNVDEWTQDCQNYNYSGAPNDGSAWTGGDCSIRVTRGGSWDGISHSARSASRVWFTSSLQHRSFGFRLARTLSP